VKNKVENRSKADNGLVGHGHWSDGPTNVNGSRGSRNVALKYLTS